MISRLLIPLLMMCCLTAQGQAQAPTPEPQAPQRWGPTGIVSIPYHVATQAPQGLEQITFQLRVDEAPHANGFYYALQYTLLNGNGGYIGIQPRSDGKAIIIFSMFGKGAEAITDNCNAGNDDGLVIHCTLVTDFLQKNRYALTITRAAGTPGAWQAYLTNVTGHGQPISIGILKPRASSLGLQGKGSGFIEYYPLIASCNEVPRTRVFYAAPRAKTSGKGVTGTITTPSTYGKCKALAFAARHDSDGWQIMTGNIDMPPPLADTPVPTE